MPIANCCVTPSEMRSIYYPAVAVIHQVVYTVPADKVFVLTTWTLIVQSNQLIPVWLRRDATRIAFNRLWQVGEHQGHRDFDPGVPFAAGETLVLEGNAFGSQHFFYGYEQDV